MNIDKVFSDFGEEILADAEQAVERSHLKGYQQAGPDVTRQRIKALYVLTVRGVRERNLGPMIAHARQVATERFAAGYDLAEVQTAINVLEEVVWRYLQKHVDREELGQALGLTSTVLGAAKDVLAGTYVGLATKARMPSLDLRSLFAGTEGR